MAGVDRGGTIITDHSQQSMSEPSTAGEPAAMDSGDSARPAVVHGGPCVQGEVEAEGEKSHGRRV
jgi:hypothetical protein